MRGIAATTRYGGADRYAVSAAVLKGFGTPSTHIYLTTGQNFPDALAAAPLAGRTGATLATVPGGCVPVDTFRAIQRLRPSSVTILGGTSAVGADVAWLRNC
ncbi:cell wall-binding repeat-containing protein [Leifsonia sp. PS1209]|nr:cell wall-binding repeat-containing protein [Leifsonia sp. PS1209]